MKLSEAIKELQKVIDKHGDIELVGARNLDICECKASPCRGDDEYYGVVAVFE